MEKADFILKAQYVLTMDDEGDKRAGAARAKGDEAVMAMEDEAAGALGNETAKAAGRPLLIEDGAVAIRGDRIIDIGPLAEIEKKYDPVAVIGGNGQLKALLPGFVNTHTHAPMVYLRGIADDLPLKEWLEKHIWPIESKWLGPAFINDATELACLEMLKGGITTYNDMYFYETHAAPAVKRMGMRAVLGAGILDFPTRVAKNRDEYFERAQELVNEFLNDELITPSVAPHALYTCGPEGQKRAAQMAEKYGIPMHIHLSETKWETGEIEKLYGQRPVKFLDGLGVLSSRVIAAHCVWLDDEEIEIMAARHVGVSHCVESNLKLVSGFAPVSRMIEAGVNVTFGTDGAASNNDLNLLGEMGTASKLHKTISEDPSSINAETAVKMATIRGAEALGLGEKIGSIKKGKAADLIMLDLDKPHLTPIYNIFSHIVYAARPSDVEAVMVNGRLVVKDGQIISADEKEILHNARAWGKKIKDSV
ncbi:MAG: amidohydrolase family protein [Nitrospiraceae bacterium]|nr:amidohydrolase family protein [Nitrospiraceae bacterium]